MPYQNIDTVLTDEQIQAIQTHIASIEEILNFRVNLTAEERRRLFKMGDKSLAFVTNSLSAAETNPDIFPASFDVAAFKRDTQLATQLAVVLARLSKLCEEVDDTLTAVGSEAMSSSLTAYDYVKTAARRQPGLKGLAAQLGERFKALGRRRAAAVADE